jgi:hypothetical protein
MKLYASLYHRAFTNKQHTQLEKKITSTREDNTL